MMTEDLYRKTAKIYNDSIIEPLVVPQNVSNFFIKYKKFLNIRFFLSNYKKNNIEYLLNPLNIRRYIDYNNVLEESFVSCYSYTRDSLKFIKTYCKEHNISIGQYPSYKENGMECYAWMHHKLERKVSIYALCFFVEICRKVLHLDEVCAKYYVEDVSRFCKRLMEVSSNEEIKTKLIKILK